MIFWYFLVIVGFIWILFATVTDIKTREVPNWLNYSLVVIGLGTRAIYSFITKDFDYILYGLIGFGIFFLIGNIMYYTKQWGGGDSKLLMGLGAMFGNYHGDILLGLQLNLPFLAVLVINIFIGGAVYGILYSVFLAVKNREKFLVELKKKKFNILFYALIAEVIIAVVLYFVFDKVLYWFLFELLVLMFVLIVLLYFMRIVEDVSMYKTVNVNKLTEGDWLVNNVFKRKKLICKTRNVGLTLSDIIILKKNKIKSVLIKEGIPFVPGFLIGFILTFVLGDLLLTLIF